MVHVMLIIPYDETRETLMKQVHDIKDKDIEVVTVHTYGTNDTSHPYGDMDIIVARGMTCAGLRRRYPQKLIIEIGMTSFDVLEAIARSKQHYNAKNIALALHSSALLEIDAFEELSGMRIHGFDIADEKDMEQVLKTGKELGVNMYVGGLTLVRRCKELGLQCIHVKTSERSLKLAIEEMLNAARTLNRERMKANMVQLVLNNAPDAILAVDTAGKITAINNQAITLLRISVADNVIGKSLSKYSKDTDWKRTVQEGTESERLEGLFGKLHYVRYRPVLVDKQCVGALLTILAAEKIQAVETKIRKELSAKGLTSKYTFQDIIGASAAINNCLSAAEKYSHVDANVLLIGETGTGKELFAHSIHHASRRRDQPFVAINCAALPENLLESELFGYVEGAFSGAVKGGKIGLFELAHKGTIFLDEIGELPSALQAKLLRVLQEREVRRIGDDRVYPVDVRVISATNIDIQAQIEEKTFRSDLYYRLDLLRVQLPPLRDRKEDVLVMADFFLKQFAIQYGKATPHFTKPAVRLMEQHAWPGNARELRNFCEKLMVLSEGDTVDEQMLREFGLVESDSEPLPLAVPDQLPLSQEELYGLITRPSLKKEELAQLLGVSRSTLWRWSKKK